ncbi:MAG: hypothetical protein E8D52_05630 [Nitrospira sp.]|nr:MAG: hypothetical protein E8D52_05630 [Nitrospira sp.]
MFLAPEAQADGYAECNQILSQDIFNKINKSDSSNSASAAAATETFFSQKDTEAFETYSKKFDEAKKNGTTIEAEFHYGPIGGELGIDVTSENKVSESEFKQKFNSAKEKRGGSKTSNSSASQNLVTTYASYVRDPGTVNAWKDCISRTKETDLYAFASRDKAGKSYVNVMWVPGVLAGSVPSISISFVTEGAEKEGIKIHAKSQEHIAMGSGRNFAVTCQKPCDEGFQVTVNGTIKNSGGGPTSSFTATVEVPPKTSLIKNSLIATSPKGKGVIVNAHSNLCLTVAGGGTATNTTAVQYLCDSDPSRSWSMTPLEGADTLKITNVHSGLCLTIAGAGKDKNNTVIQSTCDDGPSYRWRYTKVDDRTFRLVNVNSSLCLTIAGGGTVKNTAAVQYLCDGDPSRDWRFRTAS